MPNNTAAQVRKNTAREAALQNLLNALQGIKATPAEVQVARLAFDGLTSGRRPGYSKAITTVVEEVEAHRSAAAKAAVKAETKKEQAKSEKAAKPKSEKVPARKVETVKNTPGAFVRQRRLARRTKTVVAIFDLGHAEVTEDLLAKVSANPLSVDGAKYAVACEDHDAVIGVKNYEAAWRAGLDATTFCATCATAQG